MSSNQKKVIPSPKFYKSIPKSLKSLPTLKVLPGGVSSQNLDVQTQSDIRAANNTPSMKNAKGDNTGSKGYSYGKNMVINQSSTHAKKEQARANKGAYAAAYY